MRPSALPAALLLLAYGVFSVLPGGLTLCVHRDGEVRIESAAFPCCGDADRDAPDPAPPEGPQASRSSCSDCVDFPVPSLRDAPVPTAPDHSQAADVPSPPLAVASLPFRCVPPAAGRSSPAEVPRSSLPALLLASVFLRC